MERDFIEHSKLLVAQYFARRVEKTDSFDANDLLVYVVWSCHILGNKKALLSTNVSDGMYYEVTYDASSGSFYFDAYKKWENFEVSAGGSL